MKSSQAPALFGVLALLAFAAASAAAAGGGGEVSGDRTVTQVVKLLQSLLDKSKADGDTERNLYAKYKCYCDTNEEQKKAEIEKLTEEIAILEAKIEELLASTAQLSKEVAQLDADKAANALARQKATEIRGQEHAAFLALEADLTDAISKMKEAIKVLADIGADQTMNTATDHEKYMAGHSGKLGLSSLKTTVKKALLAASAIAGKDQQQARKKVEAFLQAPFTGVYSAQSGEVVGILKDMRDTFKANLANAQAVEAAALAAYDKYMAAMQKAWDDMDASYIQKQGELSSNDGDLAAKRQQLEDAEKAKADAETFLARLLDMCAAKKKQYDERVALRAQEEAALSEAIAILNSDDAFATFGTVQATSSDDALPPSLVQIKRHQQLRFNAVGAGRKAASEASQRRKAQAFLQSAADRVDSQGSTLLGRVVSMLQANNPFTIVLEEIEKMIALLEKEGKADLDQKTWCDAERQETNLGIDTAKGEIDILTGQISTLKQEIEDPQTGLLVEIDENEENLKECVDNQVTQTSERKEANAEYQKNIQNLVSAQALLERAVVVLRKYYAKIESKLEGADLLEVSKRDPSATEPAPPSTWEDTYTGQKHDGATGAIGMLEFIIDNTKKEETAAHETEVADQHAYEDSMDGLKTMEAGLEATLTTLKATLAKKRKELMAKEHDLAKTEAEKAALEAYLLKIKPGCDFITANLALRDGNRVTEKAALEAAKGHLMASPVYTEAMEAAHNESLHDCLDICAPDEGHVECKACLADVTVPGYCAGHPATPGC